MSENTVVREEEGLVLEMTRRIKASPERVFDAWSSMEALGHWFGPEGSAVVGGEVDFRVGGRYRIEIDTGTYGVMEVGGEYREIDRPHTIAFSWKWTDDEDPSPAEMTVVVTFTAAGDGETELRLVQTGFADRDSAGNHGIGWGGSFDKLTRWLETI